MPKGHCFGRRLAHINLWMHHDIYLDTFFYFSAEISSSNIANKHGVKGLNILRFARQVFMKDCGPYFVMPFVGYTHKIAV